MGTKIKVEYGGGSCDFNLMFSCEYAIILILTYNIHLLSVLSVVVPA